MGKKRADSLLFEKGLAESIEKGKRLIMEGSVFVGTERVNKPGDMLDSNIEIHIKPDPIKYVSRGGLKLEKAIKEFALNLENLIAMDIGASTGGFTDCMLKNNARKVYAVDVGYGQLDWKLRSDSRVIVMERTNIRHVNPDDMEERIDFISIDVSFISLKLVLPIAKALLSNKGEIVALVKPQFEAPKDDVGNNGIVSDMSVHTNVLRSIIDFSNKIGLGVKNLSFSPITGAKGNIEFLIHLVNHDGNFINENLVESIIEKSYKSLI